MTVWIRCDSQRIWRAAMVRLPVLAVARPAQSPHGRGNRMQTPTKTTCCGIQTARPTAHFAISVWQEQRSDGFTHASKSARDGIAIPSPDQRHNRRPTLPLPSSRADTAASAAVFCRLRQRPLSTQPKGIELSCDRIGLVYHFPVGAHVFFLFAAGSPTGGPSFPFVLTTRAERDGLNRGRPDRNRPPCCNPSTKATCPPATTSPQSAQTYLLVRYPGYRPAYGAHHAPLTFPG